MRLTRGTIIGPQEIPDSLGCGGMGEVFRARDRKLGRDVAAKVRLLMTRIRSRSKSEIWVLP